MRLPAVAHRFYPGDEHELRERIKTCFTTVHGPKRLPAFQRAARDYLPHGYIVPHAGYEYSGPVAAHAYRHIAANFPDTFIIIGPNHSGAGAPVAAVADDVWQTPLGDVQINAELARRLCTGPIEADRGAHIYEHAVEVQLPFLQYIADMAPTEPAEFSFVPIAMAAQDYETAIEVGDILANVIRGKRVALIASTDFSHYVRHDVAVEHDQHALDAIASMNPAEFINAVRMYQISMCGYGPVAAVMRALEGATARTLKYVTSGQIVPMNDVVGYGAVLIEYVRQA